MIKYFDYDSLKGIEQYYWFNFNSAKSAFYKAHRANRKRLILQMCRLK